MSKFTSIDLARIVPHGGSQTGAFEEFASQLAKHFDVPPGSNFQRNGRGSDLGVECLWTLPDKKKWAWQAKFVFNVSGLKAQADKSFESALKNHSTLERYIICIPFQPSAARGKGTSQHDKLAAYKKEWETLAKKQGKKVTIEWWTPSTMNDRLLRIDAHGGRRLYWFGTPVFTESWFTKHTDAAIAAAGPRYTAELNVGHALSPVLNALAASPEWEASVEDWRKELTAAAKQYASAINYASTSDVAEFPKALIPTAQSLRDNFESLTAALAKLSSDSGVWMQLIQLAQQAVTANEHFREGLGHALDAKYGDGASKSTRFRQHQAEWQARTPAEYYDRADEANALLARFAEWLDSAEAKAFLSGTLLITGAAGVGKTHSLCDAVAGRLKLRRYSLLLHGIQFHGGRPAWEQIRGLIGLGGDWSADAMLDALDSAGEASGHDLLVFIDALNESQPRAIWRTELPQLLSALKSRPRLKLCVSCRSGFVSDVKEDTLSIDTFEHPGFAGIEFDACRAFFEHYDLRPPVGPLFEPEFSNPLFLKLVCKTLKDADEKELPKGWSGFRTVFKALLRARDEAWKIKHGGILPAPMTEALQALGVEMAQRRVRALSLPDAIKIVDKGGVPGGLAIEQLIGDELLMKVPGSGTPGLLTDPQDELAFAYERLGDHMQVQASLTRISREAAIPPEMLELASKESGYAEALAMQLPEHSARELLDVAHDEIREFLFAPWLRALEWRELSTIGERAKWWLRQLLGTPKHEAQAFDAAVVLALRPGSVIDGKWLHATLDANPLPHRDASWCWYLHDAWNRPLVSSPVRRVIQAAWNRGATIDPDIHEAWLQLTCWFFAAADRRVRDHASRSAVRIGELYPMGWVAVSKAMLCVDDDYIVERVLASAYGTHLRVRNDAALLALAKVVASVFDDQTRANALIRDHARCICELVVRRGLKLGIDAKSLRPPFASEWPLTIPTEEDLAPFEEDEALARYPQLHVSLLQDPGGDFGIYTIPHAIRRFEKEISGEEAARWIFKHVIDLGYSEGCAAYDWQLIEQHGHGRSRPAWAERIGKKYQWIALSRLLGRLADHVQPEKDDFSDSNLSAISQRDADMSLWGEPVEDSGLSDREEVDLMTGADPNDAKWVEDITHISRLEDELWQLHHAGASDWLPLLAYVARVDRRKQPGDQGFRRQTWIQLRSYLVESTEFERLWRWAREKNFSGRWMPEGVQIGSYAFIGEYPHGLSFGDKGMADPGADTYARGHTLPTPIAPTTYEVRPEFREDCSKAYRYTLHAPIPTMLKGLTWNARDGFLDSKGQLAYVDPSVDGDGPMGCFARRNYIESFLVDNKLSLLWTTLGEKLPGDYTKIKRLDYSHIRGWHKGKIRVAQRPVTAHT